jgi:HSP20 family molecular chaperone IbpA
MNIYRTGESCIIVCEIAGMNEGDFQVCIEGNDLRIAGERPYPRMTKRVEYYCYEINYGPFGRSYWVPNVNSEEERATYQDGYLRIIVPLGKKEPLENIRWNSANFYGNVRRITEGLNSLIVEFGMPTEWPPANMYETETSQVILCEIAGMKEEDFDIQTSGDELIISGTRLEPSLEGAPTYHCLEIPSGHFRRQFPILKNVDTKDIRATYKDGFLQVTMPKVKVKVKGVKDISVE